MPPGTVLHGARVAAGDSVLDPGWVTVRGHRIAAVGAGAPPSDGGVGLSGRWLVPGFVDLHVHGGGGGSFTGPDQDGHVAAARFHARHGTTSLLATTVSAPPDRLAEVVGSLRRTMDLPSGGARVLGINLEGPYLSPECRGAHDAACVRDPDPEEFGRLVRIAGGGLRVVTLAPEGPGAGELIDAARAAAVVVSLGHTAASYDVALGAVARGATLVTHTFNGMQPLHHRRPGMVGAALSCPDLSSELIADGRYVDAAVVRLAVAAKGVDRVALVTDCLAAAGLPDGDHDLGEDGRIVAGEPADLVVLDEELTVRATMVGGDWVHREGHAGG